MKIEFNLDRYLEYQKEIFDKFENKEITVEEHISLTFYDKERLELEIKLKEIKNWIELNNLPFLIEFNTFNIQTLLSANKKLIGFL